MVPVNLKSLVGKLNPVSQRALEAAAGLCLSRSNFNVELEHWLLKLLEVGNSDVSLILRAFEVDLSRLQRDLTRTLDGLKTGNQRSPSLSPDIAETIRAGWTIASVEHNATRVRSGHLLLGLVSDDGLSVKIFQASQEFKKISIEALRKEFFNILTHSDEAGTENAAGAAPGTVAAPGQPGQPGTATKTPSLDQFTIDLTGRAKAGKIDPVLGRDAEVRQIIDILMRRRQNNPILTGEAGVGKTAVVEGFALRISQGDVPPSLKNVTVRTLDLTLLQAGAGVKGEFENRLNSVIEEVKASATPIILFIDEAHTLIGAGGQAGQGDAANILKPALARGELRTIAATTWAEYKKYFERDAALARRFQVVKVDEPSVEDAIQMMRGVVKTLEKHHCIRVLDEAVMEAVRLSHRYLSGRHLPDKCMSLLDTACARVAIGHSATPAIIENARRKIDNLTTTLESLEREQAAGGNHQERIDKLTAEKTTTEAELKQLEERWEKELDLVAKLRELRGSLESNTRPAPVAAEPSPAVATSPATAATAEGAPKVDKPAAPATVPLTDAERQQLRADQTRLSHELARLQGEHPLMQVCVDAQAVAQVLAGWTGIPVGRMVSDEIKTVLTLKERMEESIVGQSHALEAIAQSIRTSRAGLTDPRMPIGVFLLAGTSGVGKTETAITLANLLYGGEQNMTVINMSEFKEEHKVSLLMGSPPGYVGYGEGGVLTEAVRRKPYSVVLLDEMEKAHPGVQDIFYQVFDKGQMKDGEGRDIDFKNTLILMTTNAGTDLIKNLCADPETRPNPPELAAALHTELLKYFKPAFLGRLTVVPYYPISDDIMKMIVVLKLNKIKKRVNENYQASFSYSPELVTSIAARCKEVDTGARNVDHILKGTLLPELSEEFLSRMAEGQKISSVTIGVKDDGTFQYDIA